MNPLAEKAASMLRNPDGSMNWKLVSMVGFGIVMVATLMSYLKDRKDAQNKAGG